jgi:hypothetical protein
MIGETKTYYVNNKFCNQMIGYEYVLGSSIAQIRKRH